MTDLSSVGHALIRPEQRRIDEIIQSHTSSILSWKSQRNTFSSVSRLPPEILCRIFIVRDQKPDDLKAWIQLTHVSIHWRNVGINSMTLWSTSPLNKLPWLKIMLKRVKYTGLYLDVNFCWDFDIPGWNLARKYGQRIKTLKLRMFIKQWSIIRKTLPKSALQLEHLQINGGLTHLRPLNVTFSPQMSWRHFANTLKAMPNLELLCLHNAFPKHRCEQISGPPVISNHLNP